jgi:hypothetical protein
MGHINVTQSYFKTFYHIRKKVVRDFMLLLEWTECRIILLRILCDTCLLYSWYLYMLGLRKKKKDEIYIQLKNFISLSLLVYA